ncbi:MAG: BspA family leucine-rich repeat surface protein [Bacilli bacterium]|nr:BspA family leucine-rich repeat surface protein [Bacilli bacterium]
MKKIILFFILFFMPFVVFAKEDVTIKDLVLKKTTGYTEVLNDAEIINNKIVLDLKMYEVEDSVEYQFMVENNTTKDYQLDSSNLINSNNTVEYQIISEDKSSLVEKNSSKKFKLIVTYKNEVDKTLFKAGKYDSSSKLIYELKKHHLINPETGSFFVTILFIILFVSIGFIKLKNSKNKTYLLLSLFLIPFSVFALEEYVIELESNIIIGYVTPNPCTFDGDLVQGAEYTNGQYTYRYMQESKYNNSTSLYEWQNIENDGWGVRLSDSSSTDPVTTILCTSINDKPIVSMSYMFYNSKTTSIDTSSFDTSNIIKMNNMFYNSYNLEEIEVSNFDTSNVTSMYEMFFGCSSLTELDLNGFDLSNSNSFSAIAAGFFNKTFSLKKLNLSNMKLPADMANAIFRFGALTYSPIEEIDVTGWDLSNTTNALGMLGANGSNGLGGTGLKRIIGLDTWDTSHITDMNNMFGNLSSLIDLNLSSFDTSNVTDMRWMFQDCSSLEELDLSGFDLRGGSSFNSIANGIFQGTSSLKKLNLSNMKLPVDMSHSIFRYGAMNSSPIEEIDVTGWDLSHTTNAMGMLGAYNSNPDNYNQGLGGNGLKTIKGLDTWDTSHITDMSQMFLGLSSLTTLDLSNFNTSNVTNMMNMFNGCSSLTSLDLSSFDTSNVTTMQSMFSYCSSLTTLDLSSFNTTVTNTDYMFYGCISLSTGYARTQADANRFNSASENPSNINFVVK